MILNNTISLFESRKLVDNKKSLTNNFKDLEKFRSESPQDLHNIIPLRKAMTQHNYLLYFVRKNDD
jgi:hypothetical protein